MIEYILPVIKDAADYITALSLFKFDTAMNDEEAAKLLALYGKYLPECNDPMYAKLCMAADLLPGRGEEDTAVFAPLSLSETELAALFMMRDILTGELSVDVSNAQDIADIVTGEDAAQPVRILLARAALDAMVGSSDYAAMREPIMAIAQELRSIDNAVLDRYTVLIGEVRLKCVK